MADAPEKIGRYEGYGPDDIRYTQPPLFITGQTNYIRADLVDELVKASEPFVELGNRILSEAPQEAARLAVFTDHEGETHSLEFTDIRAADAALTRIKRQKET